MDLWGVWVRLEQQTCVFIHFPLESYLGTSPELEAGLTTLRFRALLTNLRATGKPHLGVTIYPCLVCRSDLPALAMAQARAQLALNPLAI